MASAGRWGRIGPLTGAAFVVLLMVGFVVAGDPPDSDAAGAEVVAFFEENSGAQTAGGVLLMLSAVALVFFAGYLRRALERPGPEPGWLPGVALGGGVLAAAGLALLSTLQFTLVEAVKDGIEPVGAQALYMLSYHLFAPLAAGGAVLVLAASIGALAGGELPAWLGWGGVVAGVVWLTPAWFVGGPLVLLWILATSIVLTRRAGAAAAPA